MKGADFNDLKKIVIYTNKKLRIINRTNTDLNNVFGNYSSPPESIFGVM